MLVLQVRPWRTAGKGVDSSTSLRLVRPGSPQAVPVEMTAAGEAYAIRVVRTSGIQGRHYVLTREQSMITVEAKLFATLRRQFPDLKVGEALSVELPEDATVAQLVNELGLPEEQVKVVFVNGTVRKEDYGLTDGDEVGIFPPVGGGCYPYG